MYYNKIRIPLLTALFIMMILDLTGVIHVPAFVIFAIAIALIGYNIYIRKNRQSGTQNKNN